MQLRTTANWPARDDRRITLVWLALFLAITLVGFGTDLGGYLHEEPAVPAIVHAHAILATIWLLILTAQVALVETDNAKLHRKFGWFAAGWAALLTVVAAWGELDHQALFVHQQNIYAHVPGRSTSFLAVSIGGLACFALLTLWAILLRKNTAAHRRVMMVANISIVSPGFGRSMRNLTNWHPATPVQMFFFFYLATVLILAAMFLWDLKKGRVMRQFVVASAFVLVEGALSIYLFLNPAWHGLTQGWIESWASLN